MQRVTPMRRLLITVTSVFMVATALVGANLAQANSVWVQSYERASETDACDSPPESLSEWRATWADPYDPISGPTWHPTWEQWANDGNGGWTCTRSVTWARNDGVTYRLGDIGPGGGLVFLISGGLTYEMAPKTWSGGSEDPASNWCNVPGGFDARGTAIGTGSANTTAMVAACASGAGNSARAYRGGGFDDWFLPSRDELNALYTYAMSDDRVAVFGFQTDDVYWTSSIVTLPDMIAYQNFPDGVQGVTGSGSTLPFRAIRAF